MKKFLLLILYLLPALVFGQTIKRQVIASFGMPHTMPAAGNFSTAITVGQPPNAGTISDGQNILRQGFQQPQTDTCRINISFDVLETSIANCGTYYLFEYTGNINPTTSITWNFGQNASPKIATGAAPPLVAFTQIGQQEVLITVSDSTCQESVTKFVDVKGTPFMALTDKTDAPCFGEKGNIKLNVQNGTAPFIFKWSTGATTDHLDNLIPGEYSFSVSDANGCKFSQSVEIFGSTQPIFIDAKLIDETCKDTKDGSVEIKVLNAAEPMVFTWSDGFVGEKHDGLTKGIYQVKMLDSLGCTVDTSFEIRVFCDLDEEDFIPDVFSPNGDGFNDLWNIPMLDQFPEATVKIYNRWGNLIWEAKPGAFQGWDGTNSSGQELQVGAYFYVIELNSPVTNRVFKGSVTIIR